MRFRVASTAALVLGLVLGGVGVASPATVNPQVVLVGHGWGHGRGLGQWGAYGYAVDQGWSSAKILDHYYGGTKVGKIGNPNITVRLSSLEASADPLKSTGSWITSKQDFTIGSLRIRAGSEGSAARIVRSGSGWQVYTTYNGCAAGNNFGPWTMSSATVKTVVSPGEDVTKMLKVCANGRSYRGTLNPVLDGTSMRLVNTLPMESYLRGVVPRESPASWGDARGGLGMAALQAQAVAARSYAYAESRYSYAKTCDTTSCQVYGGAANQDVRIEDRRTDKAIENTTGEVRLNASNAVVRTEFSSSTGGWTASGGLWPAIKDEGDSQSPRHTWTKTLDGPALASKYSVGTFQRVLVTAQNALGAEGGRVASVRIVGSTGSKDVSGSQFQSDWALYSNWFFPVDQPLQQVSSLRYVKQAYAAQIYRQFSLTSNKWTDHAAITTADWTAKGSPPVTTIGSAYVKYTWSPTIYAVTYWPQEPSWQWHTLTNAEWSLAGAPAPRVAGFIYGTLYYNISGGAAIYAQAPDDTVHHLTYAEWKAAGFPKPDTRSA
jgi:SpoIID/LytB domain protein